MKSLAKLACCLLPLSAGQAAPLTLNDHWSEISWTDVPVKEVTLFFPGKTSYEWLNSGRHKGYDNAFFATRRCNACHKDEEAGMGAQLVKASQDWLPGKQGAISLKLQVAHDDVNLHIRAQWQSQSPKPARLDSLMRLDKDGWHRLEGPGAPAEEVFSLMWDDGSLPQFATQGCFISCHLPRQASDTLTAGHRAGLEAPQAVNAGPNKYLPGTRHGHGSRPLDLQSLRERQTQGKFADLWLWRSANGVTGDMEDQWLLDSRYQDKGDGAVLPNRHPQTGDPLWMFDGKKTGFSALRKLDLVRQKGVMTLIEGHNTKAYDPKAMKPGALLPGYFIRPSAGSAADIRHIEASWDKGLYTLAFKRALDTGDSEGDKLLTQDRIYSFSIAIHDNNSSGRAHFVSFPISLSLGRSAATDATGAKIDIISSYLPGR